MVNRIFIGAAVIASVVLFAVGASAASASKFGTREFQSPSKNIGCVIVKAPKSQGGGEARCDIAQRDWTPPPKPHSCHLDWGNGLVVGEHGKGTYVCAGDTALHQGHVLAYGDKIKYAGFVCKSSTTNMRCHNRASGHGFALSREHAKLF